MHLPKVTLASKSPRRKALLEAAHIPFEVMALEVDESYPSSMPSDEVAEFLARRKAGAAIAIEPNAIILAADSIVVQDDVIFEKPVDRDDAIRIINTLQGNKHHVITGVCIQTATTIRSFSDRSDVSLAPMTMAEIEWYVDTFEPYDKAGAYGIQDWIGATKVVRIEGSYHNIMGLPVQRVYQELIDMNTAH